MIVKADDPNTMFVGNGDFIPGVTGAVQVTRDGGQSWEKANLPVEPNSVVYWLANNPEMPNVVAAASLFGYLYVSEDGGDTWSKLKKEFGEIRSLGRNPQLTNRRIVANRYGHRRPQPRRGGFQTRPFLHHRNHMPLRNCAPLTSPPVIPTSHPWHPNRHSREIGNLCALVCDAGISGGPVDFEIVSKSMSATCVSFAPAKFHHDRESNDSDLGEGGSNGPPVRCPIV